MKNSILFFFISIFLFVLNVPSFAQDDKDSAFAIVLKGGILPDSTGTPISENCISYVFADLNFGYQVTMYNLNVTNLPKDLVVKMEFGDTMIISEPLSFNCAIPTILEPCEECEGQIIEKCTAEAVFNFTSDMFDDICFGNNNGEPNNEFNYKKDIEFNYGIFWHNDIGSDPKGNEEYVPYYPDNSGCQGWFPPCMDVTGSQGSFVTCIRCPIGHLPSSLVIERNENTNNIFDIELFPIPSNDYIKVKSTAKIENFHIERIVDSYGRIHKLNLDEQSMRINISNLASGLYYIVFTSIDGPLLKPFVKN